MLVIFVHGLTVRQERFEQDLLPMVRKGFEKRLSNPRVVGCYWGDLGLQGFQGLSIPTGREGEMGVGDVTRAEDDELRALLAQDPILELRALKDEQRFQLEPMTIDTSPPEVKSRNAVLFEKRKLIASAVRDDCTQTLLLAAPQAIEDAALLALKRGAEANRQLSAQDLIAPLARCITALINGHARAAYDDDVVFPWMEIETCVEAVLAQQLGGAMAGPPEWLKRVGLTLATPVMGRVRASILRKMATFVGDCLIYLQKRDEIIMRVSAVVAREAAAQPGPIWLVGHSMGGIIAFDYCGRIPGAPIDRLITVGSQVGLFAELDSLEAIKRAAGSAKYEIPARVGSWRNVYDRDDMLSFLAAPVFDGAVDLDLDTGSPFPESHSAYWAREDLYKRVCAP